MEEPSHPEQTVTELRTATEVPRLPTHAGWLLQDINGRGKWHRYYFVLRDGILLYYRTDRPGEAPVGRLPLDADVLVTTTPDASKISVHIFNRTHHLVKEDGGAMADWSTALDTTQELLKSRTFGDTTAVPPSPTSGSSDGRVSPTENGPRSGLRSGRPRTLSGQFDSSSGRFDIGSHERLEVTVEEAIVDQYIHAGQVPRRSGFVYKRGVGKFSTWHRRWLLLNDGGLAFFKGTGRMSIGVAHLVIPCDSIEWLVASGKDRFEVKIPDELFVIRVDTAREADAWLRDIQLSRLVIQRAGCVWERGTESVTTQEEGQEEDQSTEISSKSGELCKKGRRFGHWKKLWWELRGSTLTYFTSREERRVKGVIPMGKVDNVVLAVVGNHEPGIRLIARSRTFELRCSTQEEAYSWVSALEAACVVALREDATGRRKSRLPVLEAPMEIEPRRPSAPNAEYVPNGEIKAEEEEEHPQSHIVVKFDSFSTKDDLRELEREKLEGILCMGDSTTEGVLTACNLVLQEMTTVLDELILETSRDDVFHFYAELFHEVLYATLAHHMATEVLERKGPLPGTLALATWIGTYTSFLASMGLREIQPSPELLLMEAVELYGQDVLATLSKWIGNVVRAFPESTPQVEDGSCFVISHLPVDIFNMVNTQMKVVADTGFAPLLSKVASCCVHALCRFQEHIVETINAKKASLPLEMYCCLINDCDRCIRLTADFTERVSKLKDEEGCPIVADAAEDGFVATAKFGINALVDRLTSELPLGAVGSNEWCQPDNGIFSTILLSLRDCLSDLDGMIVENFYNKLMFDLLDKALAVYLFQILSIPWTKDSASSLPPEDSPDIKKLFPERMAVDMKKFSIFIDAVCEDPRRKQRFRHRWVALSNIQKVLAANPAEMVKRVEELIQACPEAAEAHFLEWVMRAHPTANAKRQSIVDVHQACRDVINKKQGEKGEMSPPPPSSSPGPKRAMPCAIMSRVVTMLEEVYGPLSPIRLSRGKGKQLLKKLTPRSGIFNRQTSRDSSTHESTADSSQESFNVSPDEAPPE